MDILGFPKEMGIIGNLVNPGMILSTNLAEMNQVHNILNVIGQQVDIKMESIAR